MDNLIKIEEVNEKAVSAAQQKLMAQAYAVKKGDMDKSDINPAYKDAIVNISKSMTKKELKKYASTKIKRLKQHVDEDIEEETDDLEESESTVSEPVMAKSMPKFVPYGPSTIVPYLETDSKQKKKGKRNLENLKDYRDWLACK